MCDLIDERHKAILPEYVYGDGRPEGVRQRAAEELKRTAVAARKFFDVAPRPVKQQIEDGMESEPGELRGAFRADAAQRGERRRERTGGRGRCRRFGHATFIKAKTRSPKSKVV